jgi:N-acetyl-1-D-myo-inositol-2-amino-2-deoxy-alpha-D-glucopyranoside deacetylase
MGTLLLVHAHPDDESISTGGAMMKAKDEGHRVVLVTATRGEAGEIHNMDEASNRPKLAEIRTKELEAASRILGVDRSEFLGYRDSGMVGTPENADPRSFHQAPIEEAADRLIKILREERPDVVVTYAEDGVYGHPDHIKAHFVAIAALDTMLRTSDRWTPQKLYFTAIPRSLMEAFMAQMPEEARSQNEDMRIPGTPDELVTTRLDVSRYAARKREAFSVHVTQNDPNNWFAKIPAEVYEAVFGTEYYQLARGKPGSALPESDLFSGVA